MRFETGTPPKRGEALFLELVCFVTRCHKAESQPP